MLSDESRGAALPCRSRIKHPSPNKLRPGSDHPEWHENMGRAEGLHGAHKRDNETVLDACQAEVGAQSAVHQEEQKAQGTLGRSRWLEQDCFD